MKKELFLAAAIVVSTAGCTTTQRGAGIGAAVGGLGGAIIGHQTGNKGGGALLGAALGGLGGVAIGNHISEKRFCPQCGYTTSANESYCPKDGSGLRIKSK